MTSTITVGQTPTVAAIDAPVQETNSYVAKGESARGRILVPVYFGELGPYPFLLDLSIRHPVVNLKLAANVGLPRAEVGGTPTNVPLFLLRAIRCGSLPPREALVAGVDLSPLAERVGRPVAGLWPAHQPGFEVDIDVASGEVHWKEFSTSILMEDDDALPMTLAEDGAPKVNVKLLDRTEHPVSLDLSVGERISLRQSILEKLGVLKPESPRLVIQDSGVSVTQCRIPKLSLGGEEFNAVLCTVASASGTDRVGLGLLRYFKLTLNYEFGLAKLTPVESKTHQEAPLIGFGIVLDSVRDGFWRIQVVEASPADRAGLRSGDRLLDLGGERVVGVRYDLVQRLLDAESGALLRITFQRGNLAPQTVTLTAEVLL